MAGEEDKFKPKPAFFSGAFSRAWHGVYPISGFDPNNIQPPEFPSFNEEGEDNLLSLDDAENLITRPGIRLLTFLGLPVRARKHTATGEGYARKLLLNFIGWPDIPFDKMSNVRKGLAVATAFIALPWHLITMPLKFIQNIAKLATEFLPRLASEYFFNQARTLRGQGKSLPGGVFAALGYVTYALYFIGRAVTSPIQGVRQAYNQNEMASGTNLKLSRPARMVLAALSGALTVTVYSLLLPILLPLIAAKVPLVAQGVAALSQTKAGIWIGKAFSAIGEFVNPVIGTALEALGIAAAPSVIVGGATLLGATAATVLPAIDKAIDEAAKKIDDMSSSAKVFRQTGVDPKKMLSVSQEGSVTASSSSSPNETPPLQAPKFQDHYEDTKSGYQQKLSDAYDIVWNYYNEGVRKNNFAEDVSRNLGFKRDRMAVLLDEISEIPDDEFTEKHKKKIEDFVTIANELSERYPTIHCRSHSPG